MKDERLLSLDVFRGFDMMMIVGFDAIMRAADKWLGGAPGWLSQQFDHPAWFGLSFYDTIFPTFIFIAGISFPFSCAKQLERGATRAQISWRIFRRMMMLIGLGLLYNGILKLNFADFRYASVLGKIGMTWAIAAWLYVWCGRKTRIAICAALIALYGVLLLTVVAPDHPTCSSLSLEGNFVGWLDRHIQPGHLYQSNLCEPSGIVCNVFSAASAMLGIFAGEIVRSAAFGGARKVLHLLAFAAGLLVFGLASMMVMPISKRLWTPSFTLCVGAYSAAAFALFYGLVDVLKWRGWTTFFTVIGTNALTIYLLRRCVDFNGIAKFFFGGLAGLVPPNAGAVVLAVGSFALGWLVLYFLYTKKTFLKV